MTHNCRVCDDELANDNWHLSQQKNRNYICKQCRSKQDILWYKNNPEKAEAKSEKTHRKNGHMPFNENKDCPQYFGIHIVESVLMDVFTDVTRMPMNNVGYDFICSNGKKIDSKSSCLRKNKNGWMFHIRRNTIADYFILLAYDDRQHLNPLHIWLIPGHVVNHLMTASISQSTLDKWSEYEQPIDKFITCCDAMR